jgi:hypothetical protein
VAVHHLNTDMLYSSGSFTYASQTLFSILYTSLIIVLYYLLSCFVKVTGKKLFLCWHRWALKVAGGLRIFRQSAHEGGKLVSPTNQSPLPPRNGLWYSFMLEAEPIPRS